MKIKCDKCGKVFQRRPSSLKKRNYCSRECSLRQVSKPCDVCGVIVTRCRSQMFEHVFCGAVCRNKAHRKRFSEMNAELNPDRMTIETRTKLRQSRLGAGEGKSYEKTYSRHTHRIVAEQMLGRKLKPGEVVHHINENKRDNRPENLMVFGSQAEHAAWHQNLKKCQD